MSRSRDRKLIYLRYDVSSAIVKYYYARYTQTQPYNLSPKIHRLKPVTVKLLLKLRRREFLKVFSLGLAAPFLYNSAAHSQDYSNLAKTALATNLTARENQKPGTADWELENPATKREIEGYASLTSVNLGDKIKLFVNTKEPNYTI